MFNTLQEHLDHSAPCVSRWDGFDRGDIDHEDEIECRNLEEAEFLENLVGAPAPLQHHYETFVGPFQPVDMDEDIEF